MPTIAEILNKDSKKKMEELSPTTTFQAQKDRERMTDLIAKLKKHYSDSLLVITPPDSFTATIKYNDARYRIRVWGIIAYVVSPNGDRYTFEEFTEKHKP